MKPNTLTLLFPDAKNDLNFKNSWDSLQCKYKLKHITKTREKMLQPIKTTLWEKWV